MAKANSINLSDLSQYLHNTSGAMRLGDILYAGTGACGRLRLFPDSDEDKSFSFNLVLEKRKTLTENEQATQGVEQPTAKSLPQEELTASDEKGGDKSQPRITRASLSAQKAEYSQSDRLRRSVLKRRASIGRRVLLTEFENTMSPSFSPHICSTPIRRYNAAENRKTDAAQKILEDKAFCSNSDKDIAIAEKLDSILSQVRATPFETSKLLNTDPDISLKNATRCSEISNGSNLNKALSNDAECSADSVAKKGTSQIVEKLETILNEVRDQRMEVSRLSNHTNLDISAQNTSTLKNTSQRFHLADRTNLSMGKDRTPNKNSNVSQNVITATACVSPPNTAGNLKITCEYNASGREPGNAPINITVVPETPCKNTQASPRKTVASGDYPATPKSSHDTTISDRNTTPATARTSVQISPTSAIALKDYATPQRARQVNVTYCKEGVGNTPTTHIENLQRHAAEPQAEELICTNLQASPLRTVVSVNHPATPKSSHSTTISDKNTSPATVSASVQTSPQSLIAATPRRARQVNVTYCKEGVGNTPTTHIEKLQRHAAEPQGDELITDDEDVNLTAGPESSNVPLNLAPSHAPLKRSTRLSTGRETFTSHIGLPCAHPLIVRSNSSRRSTSHRHRVPLNKPPNSPINGEKFAHELKQNLARMTNLEILDLRKRHSLHGLHLVKSAKQKQIDEEIANEIARRVKQNEFVSIDDLKESDMIDIDNDVAEQFETLLSAPAGFGDSQPPSPLHSENLTSEPNRILDLLSVPDDFRDSRNLTPNQSESTAKLLETTERQDDITNFDHGSHAVPPLQNKPVNDPPSEPQSPITSKDNTVPHMPPPRPSQFIYVNQQGEISSSDDSDMITFSLPKTPRVQQNTNSKPKKLGRKRKKEMAPLLKEYLDAPKKIGLNTICNSSRRILYSQEQESSQFTNDRSDDERPNERPNEVIVETSCNSRKSTKRSILDIPKSLKPPPVEFLNVMASGGSSRGSAAELEAKQRVFDDAVFKKPLPVAAQKPKKAKTKPPKKAELDEEPTTVRRSQRGLVPAQNTWAQMYLQLTAEIESKKMRANQASLLRSMKKNSLTSSQCSIQSARNSVQNKTNKRDMTTPTSRAASGYSTSIRRERTVNEELPLENIHEEPEATVAGNKAPQKNKPNLTKNPRTKKSSSNRAGRTTMEEIPLENIAEEPEVSIAVAKNKNLGREDAQKNKRKVAETIEKKPSRRQKLPAKNPRTKKSSPKSDKTGKQVGFEHSCIDLGVTPVDHLNTIFDNLKYGEHHKPSSSVQCRNNGRARKCCVRVQRIKLPMTEPLTMPEPTEQSSLAMTSTASEPESRTAAEPRNEIASWLKQVSNPLLPGNNMQMFHQMSYSAHGNLVLTDLEGIEYVFYDTEEAGNLGYLRFLPRQLKQPRKAKRFNLHFVVMSGQFKIAINGEVGIFNAGDLVVVKKGNSYSIENITQEEEGILMIVKLA